MRSGAKLRVAMRSGAEIWTGTADPGWQSIREVVGFYNHLVITSAAQLHVQVPVPVGGTLADTGRGVLYNSIAST